ncbi:MAG: type II toxin-antitoxin system RelE/ParE family toxin [Planctomycetes bacterium]|nr:type II toxin-antitoxin system RelE/ParE family toxin [Planctomycetota bacterium]MCB9936524.1 type II toxin-antitoxin system RelE/ParE family toxin [Planctomycetota bacterium]
MRLVVSPQADTDAIRAALWYEERRPGKGYEFLEALEIAYNSIRQFPESRPQVEPGVRRIRIRSFPFHVYYRFRKERAEVLRVVHAHRRPETWREQE